MLGQDTCETHLDTDIHDLHFSQCHLDIEAFCATVYLSDTQAEEPSKWYHCGGKGKECWKRLNYSLSAISSDINFL